MTTTNPPRAVRVRMLPKDIGVALVVLLALGLGLVLREQVVGRSATFQEQDGPFSLTYPARWGALAPVEGTILSVRDPSAPSTFKTILTVERTDLDPAAPPDLQTLVDRRVAEHEQLGGYHLLGRSDRTVDGAPAAQLDYAYVVQPIDTPGRAALPVVVVARELIVVPGTTTYYIQVAAPEAGLTDALDSFERMLQTVNVQ